jgi:hypothetical protein
VTDDHLSLDELAELDEGLLPPERTSAIRAHLHGCAPCRDRADAITQARDLLGELPPLMMPADVQARLADALATESAATGPDQPAALAGDPELQSDEARSKKPPAAVGRAGGDVVPAPGAVSRRRFGRPTLATTAVAAAVVLAVGAIVIGAVNHGQRQNSESAGPALGSPVVPDQNGVAGAPAAHFFQTSTGRDYTVSNLEPDVQGLIARSPNAAAVPAPSSSAQNGTGGAGTGVGSAGGSAAGSTTTHHKAGARPSTSATSAASPRSSATLDQQPTPKPLQPLAGSQAKILACAATLTGQQDAVPLAVDFGRWTNPPYHRAPSAIFVFTSDTASAVRVFVTPPACDSGMLYAYRLVPLPE